MPETLGTLASLVGLGIALWQLAAVRRTAEATQVAVDQTRQRIDEVFLPLA
ncbi:MAG: hypothetical protein WBA12_09705 [Catalinimonas sp.]